MKSFFEDLGKKIGETTETVTSKQARDGNTAIERTDPNSGARQ